MRKTSMQVGVILLTLAGVGCGVDMDGTTTSQATQAQLSAAIIVEVVGPATINEGDTSSVRATLVCADTNDSVNGTVTWGDGDSTSATFVPAATLPGGDCGAQPFTVCGDPDGSGVVPAIPCVFAKDDGGGPNVDRYRDNNPGNSPFNVTATFTQGASVVSQGVQITVVNVAPSIDDVSSSGIAIEGDVRDFEIQAGDPGLLPEEIATVTYTFTPAAQVRNDGILAETISCDCSDSPHCDNGLNSALCGVAGASSTVDTVPAQLLDDDGNPFNLSVTVTDKDGLSDTDNTESVSIGNLPPQNLIIAGLSQNSGAPTPINEGALTTLSTTFNEAGIDQLTILFDHNTLLADPPDLASPDISGSAEVVKATYPAIVNANPADILAPQVRFDDQNAGNDDTVRRVTVRVTDDDLGQNTQEHFVRVLDVDPFVNALTANGVQADISVNEGQQVLFDAPGGTFGAGDSNSGLDPLRDPSDRWHWFVVRDPGGPDENEDDVGDGTLESTQYQIVAGCLRQNKSCTLRFVDDDPLTTYDVRVRLFDEDSSTDSPVRRVTVNNVAPTITAMAFTTANSVDEGTTVGVNVSFDDPSVAFDGTYTLTVDFGNQPTATVLTTTLASPGAFATLSRLFTDNDECAGGGASGTCTVSARVCETGDAICSATQTLTLTVNNVAPVATATAPSGLTLVEGQAFSFDGSYNDIAAAADDPFAFSWSWNDGATARSVSGSSSFASRLTDLDVAGIPFVNVPQAGLSNVPFTLSVTDEDGGNDTDQVVSSVRDNVPTVTINDVFQQGILFERYTIADGTSTLNDIDFDATPDVSTLVTSGDPIFIRAGDTATFAYRFTAELLIPEDDDYTLCVNSDDGSRIVLDGTTLVDNDGLHGEIELCGTRTLTAGRHSFVLTYFQNQGGAGLSASWSDDGGDFNRAFDASDFAQPGFEELATPTVTVTFAAETDADLVSNLVVTWGDGTTTTFSGAGISGVGAEGNTVSLTKPITYPDSDGNPATADTTDPFVLRVTVNDEDSSAFDETDVVVDNVAPEIISIVPSPGPVVVSEGTAAAFVITATDVAPPDRPGLLTTVDYGDGFVDVQGGVLTGAEVVSRSAHAYTSPGTFTVTIFVTDKEGGQSATQSIQVEVVNIAPVITDVFTTAPAFEGEIVSNLAVVDNRGGDVLDFAFNPDCDTTDGIDNSDFATAVGAGDDSAVFDTSYDDDAVVDLCVRVCDDDNQANSCDFASTTIIIDNADPRITSFVLSPATIDEGGTTTLTVGISDAGDDSFTTTFDCDDDGTPDVDAAAAGGFQCRYTTSGVFNARATVTDDDGGVATATRAVRVNNVAPALTAFTATTVDEGQATTFAATASDAGADALTLQIDTNGDGAFELSSAFAGANASINFAFATSGARNVAGRACDSEGACSAATTIAVTVNNLAPVLGTVAAANVNEGQPTVFTADANDAGNDALRFEFDVDNDGDVDLTSTSGTASFTFGTDGAKSFRARVCDSEDACSAFSAVQTTTVLNVAPVIQTVNAPATANEGAGVTVSAQASDAGNDALSFTFTFARAGLANVVVGPQANATATVALPEDGAWTLTVAATDVAAAPNSAATTTANANIAVQNVAPAVTAFNSVTVAEGGFATLAATAVDPAGVNDTVTLAFDCNNDGANDVDAQAGTAGFQCRYASSGVFTARVTASDEDGGSSQAVTTVIVNNVAPTLNTFAANTVNQGQATTLTATVADAGNDAVTVLIDTNNDGVIDINALANNAGVATAQAAFARGTRSVTARACDIEGACSANQTIQVTVNNVAPTITSINVPATALAGSPVTVNIAANDAGNDALTFTYVFTGPGTNLTVGPQAGTSATASFSDAGTYNVSVTANDGQATSAPATQNFVVNELSSNVIVSANPAPINEGDTTDISVTIPAGVGPFLVSIDITGDGDFEDARDFNAAPCSNDPCVFNDVLFPQNRQEDIAFRMLVQVTDEGNNGSISTALLGLDVLNVAPTLDPIDSDVVEELEALTVVATADDVGLEDLLTFELLEAPAGMTIDEATGEISWVPTFDDEGDNDVTVRVSDSDGARAQQSFVVTVTIIDTNSNDLSDTFERAINGGELFDPNAGNVDTDGDGETDLVELLAGRDPNQTDAPTAPVIISPDNGIAVNTAAPTLRVASATSSRGLTLTYTFCVVDTNDVETCETDVESGGTTTSVVFDAIALVEGELYQWFAVANDGLVDGEESARGSFVVDAANAAPPTPVALSPANGSGFVEGTLPTLEVRAVVDPDGDAVTYVFEVATSDTFATILVTSEPRAVPFFTLGEALAAGSYFWRARASDGELTSGNSATADFDIDAIEVNTPPSAPGIGSPNNETIGATNATLTITAGSDDEGDALEYEFELADNAAFANAVTSGRQAGLTFDVSDLAEDSVQFWRARAFDGELYSDWVQARFGVDAANGEPIGLAILSPADGALLQTAPKTFVVQNPVDPEGDALSYTLTIANDAEFGDVVATATAVEGGGTTTFEAPADFAPTAGNTLFWKVTVSDGDKTVEVAGSFSLFAPPSTPPPSGCGCDAQGQNSSALAIVGLVVLAAIRRRRR